MSKIRLGVIGAGRMGLTHLAMVKADPRVEVSSVADNSGVVLQVLERYIGCAVYKDATELIRKDRPDAVLVCTPPGLHYDISACALEHGVHAFVEKPFTTSPQQAVELADRFEAAGLVNQVGYVNRFNDVFRRVSAMLAEGILGRLRSYRSEMFSRTVIRPQDHAGWRGSHKTGGGATFEMASHAIDLVRYLIGAPQRVVGTLMKRIHSASVEDMVSSSFVHANACSGYLFVNWSDETVRKPTNKIDITGEKGRILADQHSVRVHLNAPDKSWNLHDGWNTLYITDVFESVPFYVRGNEYTRQLLHFVDLLEGKMRNGHCSFREAAGTLALMESMFADAEKNEVEN